MSWWNAHHPEALERLEAGESLTSEQREELGGTLLRAPGWGGVQPNNSDRAELELVAGALARAGHTDVLVKGLSSTGQAGCQAILIRALEEFAQVEIEDEETRARFFELLERDQLSGSKQRLVAEWLGLEGVDVLLERASARDDDGGDWRQGAELLESLARGRLSDWVSLDELSARFVRLWEGVPLSGRPVLLEALGKARLRALLPRVAAQCLEEPKQARRVLLEALEGEGSEAAEVVLRVGLWDESRQLSRLAAEALEGRETPSSARALRQSKAWWGEDVRRIVTRDVLGDMEPFEEEGEGSGPAARVRWVLWEELLKGVRRGQIKPRRACAIAAALPSRRVLELVEVAAGQGWAPRDAELLSGIALVWLEDSEVLEEAITGFWAAVYGGCNWKGMLRAHDQDHPLVVKKRRALSSRFISEEVVTWALADESIEGLVRLLQERSCEDMVVCHPGVVRAIESPEHPPELKVSLAEYAGEEAARAALEVAAEEGWPARLQERLLAQAVRSVRLGRDRERVWVLTAWLRARRAARGEPVAYPAHPQLVPELAWVIAAGAMEPEAAIGHLEELGSEAAVPLLMRWVREGEELGCEAARAMVAMGPVAEGALFEERPRTRGELRAAIEESLEVMALESGGRIAARSQFIEGAPEPPMPADLVAPLKGRCRAQSRCASSREGGDARCAPLGPGARWAGGAEAREAHLAYRRAAALVERARVWATDERLGISLRLELLAYVSAQQAVHMLEVFREEGWPVEAFVRAHRIALERMEVEGDRGIGALEQMIEAACEEGWPVEALVRTHEAALERLDLEEGERRVEALERLWRQAPWEARSVLMRQIGAPEHVALLSSLMAFVPELEAAAQLEAAGALERIGHVAAEPVLAALVRGGAAAVALRAAEALEVLGTRLSLGPLYEREERARSPEFRAELQRAREAIVGRYPASASAGSLTLSEQGEAAGALTLAGASAGDIALYERVLARAEEVDLREGERRELSPREEALACWKRLEPPPREWPEGAFALVGLRAFEVALWGGLVLMPFVLFRMILGAPVGVGLLGRFFLFMVIAPVALVRAGLVAGELFREKFALKRGRHTIAHVTRVEGGVIEFEFTGEEGELLSCERPLPVYLRGVTRGHQVPALIGGGTSEQRRVLPWKVHEDGSIGLYVLRPLRVGEGGRLRVDLGQVWGRAILVNGTRVPFIVLLFVNAAFWLMFLAL